MPFSPSSLFGSGERGIVWDLSDLSNLSQTIDGATPVTTTGQSVGWVRDVSGNNNHWIAASNGTSRPTYQVDSDGKPYLNFDGSNDILFAATPFHTTSSPIFSAFIGVFGAAPATQRYLLGSESTSTTAPFVEPFSVTSAGAATVSIRRDDSGTFGTVPSIASMFNSTKRVLTSQYDGPSASSTIRMRDAAGRPSDGLSGNYTSVSNSNYSTGTNTFTTVRAGLGGRAFGTPASFFPGRIYSGIVINRFLTDSEIKSAEEWVSDLVLTTALPGQAGGVDGSGSGAAGTVTLTAPTGAATGGGNAAGGVGTVTTSTPTGLATGSASGLGGVGNIVLTVPAGIVSGAGNGLGSVGTVTLTAPTGIAAAGGSGSGAGGVGTVTIGAPTGAASGSALATGSIGTITATAPQGLGSGAGHGASGTNVVQLFAPTGVGTGFVPAPIPPDRTTYASAVADSHAEPGLRTTYAPRKAAA